ncbi:MAG: hypothetical protein ACFE7R_09855, partial [Candidatus Hodarchaeota archaeon]
MVKESKITHRLKQTGELLLGGAKRQVGSYKTRFESLEGVYDSFLSKLMHQYSTDTFDLDFIDKFFGKRELRFAGIDGTVCTNDVFDLIVFFAGAYSSNGTIRIDDSGKFGIKYDMEFVDQGVGVSSVLPIYINEVPLVDQTLLTRDEEGAPDESVSYSDSWIIDNSAFANYLMTLSEFYLALRLVSGDNPVDILLLDRICSSEISSSYAETSDFRINLEKECGLIGKKINERAFTSTEWIFARRLFGNLILGTPPSRGEYLLPRVVLELLNESGGGLTREELIDKLGLINETQKARLDKELESGIRGKGASLGIITR